MNDLHNKHNSLYIEYSTGHIEIYMDEFFPCNISVFKKLLGLINSDTQHKTELKEKLRNYFQEQILKLIQSYEENIKIHLDNKQYATDTQRLIESCKHPNGVPLSEKEIEQAMADLKQYKSAYQTAFSYANRSIKSKEKFEKYLQLL